MVSVEMSTNSDGSIVYKINLGAGPPLLVGHLAKSNIRPESAGHTSVWRSLELLSRPDPEPQHPLQMGNDPQASSDRLPYNISPATCVPRQARAL